MSLLKLVLNSEKFKERFCNTSFRENRGNSGKEIYYQVMSGADKFNGVADSDLDIRIEAYYSRKSVVGYTYPSTWWTWINRRYFAKFDLPGICGNVFHEYLHNCGYGHRIRWGRSRTVPYKGGYIVREIAREMLDT
jgi:hypothetical protein